MKGTTLKTYAYWEDNIKMYLMEIGQKGMDWIHLAEDRVIQWAVVNMVMNLWLPCGKFLVSRLKIYVAWSMYVSKVKPQTLRPFTVQFLACSET